MKKYLLAGIAAAAVMLSAQAFAQSVKVEIDPTHRTKIKEYVTKEKVRPVTTIKERVHTGYRVPADVELHEVPADWGPSVSRYRLRLDRSSSANAERVRSAERVRVRPAGSEIRTFVTADTFWDKRVA